MNPSGTRGLTKSPRYIGCRNNMGESQQQTPRQSLNFVLRIKSGLSFSRSMFCDNYIISAFSTGHGASKLQL